MEEFGFGVSQKAKTRKIYAASTLRTMPLGGRGHVVGSGRDSPV